MNARDNNKDTPLHIACDNGVLEVVTALIDKGAAIDARNSFQETPLHLACVGNNIEVAKTLIDKGANINIFNRNKKKPFMLIKEEEDRLALKSYVEDKKSFVTRKNKWKVYLKETEKGEFDNLNGEYEVEFTDGSIYNGQWKDDKKNGKGHFIWANGDIYKGDYEEDKMHGKGEFITPIGNKYEGDYEEDKMHGKGKFTYKNDDVYEGDFQDNKRHGNGTLTYANGDVYEGNWENDKINGEGKYTFISGLVYEGDWIDGEKNGKGKFTYKNGDMYEGDFKDDKRHGKGKFTYNNGNVYEGYFQDGKKHGKGILTHKGQLESSDVTFEEDYLVSGEGKFFDLILKDNNNQDVLFKEFEGKIEDTKNYTGNGTLKTTDDSIYEGSLEDGKRHGKGKMIFINGDIYEGYWKNGFMNGNGTYTYVDGNIYEGDIKQNKKHGKGTLTYANGDIYEGNFIENNPNGYGVRKYKDKIGCIPAGSTYEGYWKDGNIHTENTELGKLTWPSHDSDYPDKSTPCGLRSFEGQWENGNPKISREYNDFPTNLENWGNYRWTDDDNNVVLDQERGLAYQIHQKGKKMQEKLGPALEFMDKEREEITRRPISEYLDETPQGFIQSLKDHGRQSLKNLSENEGNNQEKYADLDRILVKLSRSEYVKDEKTKRIIAICFYYALGPLYKINEGVKELDKAGVEHEPEFVSYYINTFIEDNAGAYISEHTLNKASSSNKNPEHYLINNDSYTFFKSIDGLIYTSPTLTNVNDFRAVLIKP